ncbi:hypothetical protein XM38_042770 [Halomicronema hongdechloris C2206]|uniref:NurA domain-containing protein n=1 Tax=Halomicronema hongdechloris C2206 TaxID=1641165 RepID=A0A1Z3HSM7_9CYAN|nr:DNA double-strand break repair nuclease NurA [Halomicronema hongdechloris]ASC73313.1 hypothetical protein XM38_042770 [Halomicronema hongdechloris C2206]
MLDLMKLARQMQGISHHLTQEAAAAQRRVEIAERLLTQILPHQAQRVEQLQQWCDRMGFTAAYPVEPLDTPVDVQPTAAAHTVLATDGSQISPSHHEIAYCYLINVGRVVLHYGQSRYPRLDSLPQVIYRPEDLYISRQWSIRTEEWMGYQRTVAEAVALAELADQVTGDVPALALVDGSLIYWFLESLPQAACDRILPPILAAWDRLKQTQIPLVGYLSASRSGEALNFFRLQSCPYQQPDCLSHCPGPGDQAPCQVFNPLRDTTFWATQLAPGQRSPLWRSSAPLLQHYHDDQAIYFCYVHVGAEIARLEMPAWVATNPQLLSQALNLSLTQVQKGYGYPVILAEAHNQAVVRGGDRTRFFALLEQEMIRAGLKNVGTSYKEARKRGSIA